MERVVSTKHVFLLLRQVAPGCIVSVHEEPSIGINKKGWRNLERFIKILHAV